MELDSNNNLFYSLIDTYLVLTKQVMKLSRKYIKYIIKKKIQNISNYLQ